MTRTVCAAPAAAPDETPLEQQLQETIRALPFGAVAALVRQLLVQMGYAGVCVRRTKQRGHNGRDAGPGGWDVEARWETGLSREKLIVQVKHRPDGPAVQMRCVDELRGAMLRAGAGHGLLVSTGTISAPARDAALAASESLTLVDGEALRGLLRAHGVGLRRDVYGAWRLDEVLFARLRRLFPPRASRGATQDAEPPDAGQTAPAPHPRRCRPLTLTVTTAFVCPARPGRPKSRG